MAKVYVAFNLNDRNQTGKVLSDFTIDFCTTLDGEAVSQDGMTLSELGVGKYTLMNPNITKLTACSGYLTSDSTKSFSVMFDPMDATQEEQAALAASTATTPNYTVNDLCLGALKLMGIEEAGETSTYDDLADALFFLNLLLDEWSVDRNKIYVRKEDTKVLTVGTGLYSIGEDPLADINTVIPIKIEQAYLRNLDIIAGSGYLDYYLDVTMQQEEYNEMPIKALQTIPTRLFFLKTWPLGALYLNYLPDKAYEMHLFSWKPLQQFTDLQDVIELPDGYKAALTYNLAVNFAPAFGKEVSKTVFAKAQVLARAISDKNYEIPRIKMQGIPGTRRIGGSIYNPFVKG